MAIRDAAFSLKLMTVKRDAGHLYDELLRNERLPADELARLTDTRASAMAAYAFDSSPFYRDLYTSAGINRSDLDDPAAFVELPVIDRTMVKDHADAILQTEVKGTRVRTSMTGGSTGEPLTTYNDANAPLIAMSWRMYKWWGIEPWDDVAHVGRLPGSKRAQLMTWLTWWPTRLIHVDATYLEPAAIEKFIEKINQKRPRMVEGFVGSLHEVAEYAQRRGLTMHKPHVVGATAAPLTAEGRAYLEAAWGAPVHDQYRSAEIPWMAGECGERNGLHIFSDVRRIEMLDDSGSPVPDGVNGNVVVSDLINRVFPLVRYRLGDIASLRADPCRCGVTLPLMDQPDGRTVDLIRLPDGTTIGAGLFGIFAAVPEAVRLFQLHQNADFSIILRIVQGPSPRAREQVDDVVKTLHDRLKGQVPVSVEYVDSLPFTGGKIKYVTSDIKATV